MLPAEFVFIGTPVGAHRIADDAAAADRLELAHDDLATGIESQAMLTDCRALGIGSFALAPDRAEGGSGRTLALGHAERAREANDPAQPFPVELIPVLTQQMSLRIEHCDRSQPAIIAIGVNKASDVSRPGLIRIRRFRFADQAA